MSRTLDKTHSSVQAFPASRALKRALTRALRQQKKARQELSMEPVHDVRVAIRRCRSLAEGFSSLEPASVWRDLRKTCKKQARGLTELRDAQVLGEWAKELGINQGNTGRLFRRALAREERTARRHARKSLRAFPRKRWKRWRRILPARAELIPVGQPRLAALAWERITDVCRLDRRWRRYHGVAAWHRLRVSVKRFRYVVESFLPEQYAAWEKDLVKMQDLLGEGHDLDVLRGRILKLAHDEPVPKGVRTAWLRRIEQERIKRTEAYERAVSRHRVHGRDVRSPVLRAAPQRLWDRWRAELALMARLNLATGAALVASGARRASPVTGRSLPRRGTRLRTSSVR